MKKIIFVLWILTLSVFGQEKVNLADSNKVQSGYYVTPYWLQNHSGIISLNQFSGANFKANMDSALAYISTAQRTIRLPIGINSLTENLIIPSNVTLDFTSGGMISITNGDTLVIKGSIIASDGAQIFDTTGNVDLSNSKLDRVYAKWFGVVNSTSIKHAINSISKGTVDLGNYTYSITSTVTLKDSINIIGNYPLLMATDTVLNIFTLTNQKAVTFKGLILKGKGRKRHYYDEGAYKEFGNGINATGAPTYGVQDVVVDDCKFYRFQNGIFDNNGKRWTIKNSYFEMTQDSAFTCLHFRGTSDSYIYNNRFIDSNWGDATSTVNAIYWYPGEQMNYNSVIEKNYFYGFGKNLFPSSTGFETMVLVGGSWQIINNIFEKGIRAIDIATYPYSSTKVWKTVISGNKFKGVEEWAIKMEKNEIGVPGQNFQQRYDIISENVIDSCRNAINLYDSTSFVVVVNNVIRKCWGGAFPPWGSTDGAVTILSNNHHIIFAYNIMDSLAFGGISTNGGIRDCIIEGNIISNYGLAQNLDWATGIRVYSNQTGYRLNKRNKIINNTVTYGYQDGIYLSEGDACIVGGNNVYQAGKNVSGQQGGIVLVDCDYTIVTNNISSAQSWGLRLSNLGNSSYVQFNQFYGNSDANISVFNNNTTAFGEYDAGTDSVKGGTAMFNAYSAVDYYKQGTNPATAGGVRLSYNNGSVRVRGVGGTYDYPLISVGIFGSGDQITIGANLVSGKVRIYPGTSEWFDFLGNGDFENNGNIHLINSTKAIKMTNATLLDKRTLNLNNVNGVDPLITMDGVQILTKQQAAVSDATGTPDLTYDQNEVDMLNSLKTQLNLLLTRMRYHGLISQ